MEDQPFEVDLNEYGSFDEDDVNEMQRQIDASTIEDPLSEVSTEAPAQESQSQQPTTSTEVEPKEEKEKGNALKTTAEAALAIPTGTLDWGISLYNTVMPGEVLDLPNIPEFENDVTQTIREISQVVVPTIFITRGLGGVAMKAHTARNWKLGNDVFFRWFAKTGLAGGSGVIADAIAPVQEKDHNALGTLKKTWPETYGWVSDDFATLDDDEPDLKRKKNILEGLGIGFAADLLTAVGKLAKSLRGVARATQWVPENEKAANILKNMQEEELSTDPLENVVLQSAKRRYDQLTEIGEVKLGQVGEPTEPILGYHDAFDYGESGARTGDPSGIFGASVDQAKILNNIDTINGRVGSVMTPGAMEYVVNGNDAGHRLITRAADLLKDSKYGYRASNGKYLSHEDIVLAGTEIAADLYKLDVQEMDTFLKTFSGVDVSTGARVLNDEAYAGVMGAIKKYSNDFINMDIARAQAYVSTSLAGQVSDMAEGARLYADKVGTVQRAQDQVLDRLQYLMQIKGTTSYARGRALNMLNLWKRVDVNDVKAKDALAAIKNETNDTLKALNRLQKESKQTIDTLRAVKAQRPDLLGPLMLAYEITDGKVATVSALNDYIRNTTGVFKKALVDVRPDMPSAWTQGMWANIYNSVLSSVGTPLKAGASNVALMIERPIATFAGAMLNGDTATLRRASYMYNVGMVDTLQKAFGHMKQVYSRAARDPGSVGYIMRDDIARKNDDQMKLLRSFSDAKEVEGMYGPSVITNQIELMNDLAEHPAMRFSANAMTAFDGFTRSFIGNIEARGRAYDKLIRNGEKITPKNLKQISDDVYGQMFDDKGFITDKAVEYASREIAMNLDNKAVNSLSDLIRRAPFLKPFLMFPKTSMNMLAFSGSHNPLGVFINDLNAFKHSVAEGVSEAKIDELLSARGIPLDENKFVAYETIRAELKGRKAIGALTVLGAGALFTTDRLHGNGIYDKTRQKVRRESGWKPRHYKGWDGKWYSYDNMGAISDWLALTADIMDNFDTLDPPTLETQLNKMGYILSANLTNKSFTAGLEPLNDVLAGNPAALSRWGASFGSGLVPFSGARNELGRLLEPQLKEVDQDFFQLLANRNVGAKSGLPDVYDWVDGGKVGEVKGFWQRGWNTFSPWFKQGDAISPEKQFLIDIEFDGRPQLRTNGQGIEYTPEERSEITEYIGKSGYFKRELQRIMKSIDGKEFRKQIKNSSVNYDRKLYKRIHKQIKQALNTAKNFAENQVSTRDSINKKVFINEQIKYYTETGNEEEIQRLLDYKNK